MGIMKKGYHNNFTIVKAIKQLLLEQLLLEGTGS